jgi:anti-anti-sigma factor
MALRERTRPGTRDPIAGWTEASPGLKIIRSSAGAAVELAVEGELDTCSAGALDSCLRREELAGAPAILVDLYRTRFIDAGGVRVLVEAARRAGEAEWTLTVINARGLVRKVFDLTQLDAMIEHWQTRPLSAGY